MKNYERYGIPDNLYLDNEFMIPDYSFVYIIDDESSLDTGSAVLNNSNRALWGAAEYWTVLEASLLVAGLNPNDVNLYAIGEKCTRDRDSLPITTHYFWINESLLSAAKDYLFLFERSTLSPKAPPIDWIKYYKQKILGKSLQHEAVERYAKDWFVYFNIKNGELDQSEIITKPESTRKTENLLRALAAIAIDDYRYDSDSLKSTAPQDIADALSKRGVNFDPKTIRGWLKEGTALLPPNHNKK